MKKFTLGLLALSLSVAFAQEPAPASAARVYNKTIGNVTAIDPDGRKLTVTADGGAASDVLLNESTSYMRVPPGEKDLKKATRIELKDISVGDRVYARSLKVEGSDQTAAVSVIVMSKTDIVQHQQKSGEEWQKRGVAGKIKGIDPASKQVTLATQTSSGIRDVVIQTDDKTGFRRYAPDSVKFSDAKSSAFTDLNVGDSVRALGDKSAEGTTLHAEELVSGSFRNIAGAVISVNAAGNEIRLNDLETKKPVTIEVNSDTNLKKLPPNVASMLARMQSGNSGGGAGAGAASGPPHTGTPGPGGPGGTGGTGGPGGPGAVGRPGGGRPDMNQMLERMPAFALVDLKPGDALFVTSTKGSDPSRVTAISVVAGVDPIIASAPKNASQSSLGGQWSFDIGLPQ